MLVFALLCFLIQKCITLYIRNYFRVEKIKLGNIKMRKSKSHFKFSSSVIWIQKKSFPFLLGTINKQKFFKEKKWGPSAAMWPNKLYNVRETRKFLISAPYLYRQTLLFCLLLCCCPSNRGFGCWQTPMMMKERNNNENKCSLHNMKTKQAAANE